jgi:cytosine/adenosine deaminase-related metal-dependent hydrolase
VSAAEKTLLVAAWVAPMTTAILRDAAVAFGDGHILDLGDARTLRRDHPDATVIDLGSSIILPGLVNAHTHLELSGCESGSAAGGSFTQWLLSLPARIHRDPARPSDEAFVAAAARGIEQSLRYGITCVGDISQQMHLTRPILREASIRAVSYGEVIGLAARKHRFDALLARALDRSCESEKLRIGLTPHSPYTVDLNGFRTCLDLARAGALPLATHLAESPHEREFFEHHRGPFREMWESLGHWGAGIAEKFSGSPVALANTIGLLDYPTLLAHVNYVDDDDLAMLARGSASVVYCPRTHAYFGHPPHRWREMLSRGINVAIGTDSCASSPDLNLVDDLRLMHRIAPDCDVHELWQMATIRAAGAIRRGRELGSLEIGKAADFAVFPTAGDQPLQEILESDMLPATTWVAGRITGNPRSAPC